MSEEAFVLAQREAAAQSATADEWFGLLREFVIANDQQQEQVAGVLRDVKARYKVLEDKRTEITRPLNQALRAVNDLFRPPKQRFESLEKLLKDKISAYLRQKSEANAAALKAAAVAATPEAATQIIQQVAPVVPPQGVFVRQVWRFEVTDPDLVPREFCSPDPDKIRRVAPETASIPGVRFYQEDQVSARR